MQFNVDTPSRNAQQIFFSDLDGTLLGNDDALEAFNVYWMEYASRFSAMLVYNTGRPLAYVEDLINRGHLLHAEYMICGNGNNIYHRGKLWEPWLIEMEKVGYSLNLISIIDDCLKHLRLAAVTVSTDRQDLSLRWWVECEGSLEDCFEVYSSISAQVQAMGNVYIYTYTLDEAQDYYKEYNDKQSYCLEAHMYPPGMNRCKGPSAKFLFDELQKSSKSLNTGIWAGDAENDVGMLSNPSFKGILVANHDDSIRKAAADPTLRCTIYRAKEAYAAGVVEGLQFFSES